jgi:hypothetical protein
VKFLVDMIMLDRAGQEVCAIVLVPTLSGTSGEPMASM